METLGKVVVVIAALLLSLATFGGLVVYSIFIGAFVVHTLWAWFLVPALHVAPLSIVAAYGLMLIVNYVTWQGTLPQETDKKKQVSNLANALLRPWLVLFFGWILKHYM